MQDLSMMRGAALAGVVLLSACATTTQQPVSGTYRADFDSSSAPDVALAGQLQELALRFEGDRVFMRMDALGANKTLPVDARFESGRVVLEQPEDWVLAIRDAETLECVRCPEGVPDLWKKAR